MMVQGVPAIGVMSELVQRCALYGVVEEYRPLDEYPAEAFTEVYLIKFQKLPAARFRMPICFIVLLYTCSAGPPDLLNGVPLVNKELTVVVVVSGLLSDTWMRRASLGECSTCATFPSMRRWRTPG